MAQSALLMLLMLAALMALAMAMAWLVRRAGLIAGWAVVGGALAGIALGPTILGRVMPDQFERWFIGGVEQRQARDSLVSLQGADLAVAEHRGFSQADVTPIQARHASERSLINLQIESARWKHQAPMRTFALIVVAIAFVGGGLLAVPAVGSARTWLTIVSVGLWSAALPGGVVFACGANWWDLSPSQTLMLVAAVAIGPWAILGWDRATADAAEVGGARMIQSAGRVASLLAIACAAWAVWQSLGLRDMLIALPLVALPLGWMLPAQATSRAARRRFFEHVVIPALAASVAMKIDAIEHAALWSIVVIAIVCGDGRWFGAVLGALLPGGRRVLRTMRLVLGAMASGPTQLAVCALGVHAGILPENLALALLIGAAVIDVSAPLRRRLADQMETLEAELEEDARNED
jgi:hypothetical protein